MKVSIGKHELEIGRCHICTEEIEKFSGYLQKGEVIVITPDLNACDVACGVHVHFGDRRLLLELLRQKQYL